MSAKYEITVSVTALCACCGEEILCSMTEARPTGHPFERDNPFGRVDRRALISVCDKCFVHKPIADGLLEALEVIMYGAEEWINMNLPDAVGDNARAAIANARGKS